MNRPGTSPLSKKVGVLVVDDSPVCRQLITEALLSDPDLEVVGVAADGAEAILRARELRPSVITMDVDMPVMDGLAAVQRIMAETPTPILVLTGDPRKEAPTLTCRALELGALALQVKPAMDMAPEAKALTREVKLLASVKVIRHLRGAVRRTPPPVTIDPRAFTSSPVGLVAIVSSTGGPQVLHKLASELPAEFPAPIVIVQHINAAFTESLAGWLAASARLKIRLAKDGDALVPGQVLIAPPNVHVTVPVRGRIAIRPGPAHEGHCPSGSLLLESAARAYGRRALGVILTGMGSDGADGAHAIHAAGGTVIAQSHESCVVFGMPQAAIGRNAVSHIVHGDEIAATLLKLARGETLPAAAAAS